MSAWAWYAESRIADNGLGSANCMIGVFNRAQEREVGDVGSGES
jgi:hypothetical protein